MNQNIFDQQLKTVLYRRDSKSVLHKKSEIKKKKLTWISFGFEFMRFEADHGNSLQALFTQLTRIQICHIMTIEDIPKFLFEDA